MLDGGLKNNHNKINKMNKKILVLVFFLLLIFNSHSANAASDYVLPYPSFMPGSSLYKLHQIFEYAMKYWYFGNFGQFNYNLKESDKYLVEARTLFEYKQYLLAHTALEKSNYFFKNTKPYLQKAKQQGKDIDEKLSILNSASQKHIEILQIIKKEVPDKFTWSPEKSKKEDLFLHLEIDKTIKIRLE